ncbi:MAG: DNA polymerase III subunit delta' [Pseudomonadota bacterium]
MVGPYPWQRAQWRRLNDAIEQDKLGHANLLSGIAGAGHDEFATQFAQRLLCEKVPDGQSYCGECRGCLQFVAGSHPDFMRVAPEEEGKAIGIDQIRSLSGFYALKPHYGGRKVTIISPAENMNRAASNALLKTLEEPPAGSTILLVTDRYDAISMTVRSRCQRVPFERIEYESAKAWLEDEVPSGTDIDEMLVYSGGAPLQALRRMEEGAGDLQDQFADSWQALRTKRANPLEVAQTLRDTPIDVMISELAIFIYSLIRSKILGENATEFEKVIPNKNLQACINELNLRDLYAISDVISEARRQLLSATNPRDADLLDTIWLTINDRVQMSTTAG